MKYREESNTTFPGVFDSSLLHDSCVFLTFDVFPALVLLCFAQGKFMDMIGHVMEDLVARYVGGDY